MNKTVIFPAIILLAAVGIVIGMIFYRSGPTLDQVKLDAFAQCLAAKKITMYGAAWCTHCQAEKARFGSSFTYIPYVECPENQKLCIDKGINGYPTWITEDGTKYEGEQKLEGLAKISGCPLPSEK